MIQKQSENVLSSLDLIILIGVFGLAIAFTGILLPSERTQVSTENQTANALPYTDTSSNKSLQIKNIKFNSSSPDTPAQENETCENSQTQDQVQITNQNAAN
jgi:hypothetical protein